MKTPDDYREAIRRYMESRGLTHAGWAKAAGISSRTIPAFLAGRARSLTHGTLQKMAEATGDPIPVILGEMPDKLEEKNSILNRSKSVVDRPRVTLTEAEMQQLDAMTKAIETILARQEDQNKLLERIAQALENARGE